MSSNIVGDLVITYEEKFFKEIDLTLFREYLGGEISKGFIASSQWIEGICRTGYAGYHIREINIKRDGLTMLTFIFVGNDEALASKPLDFLSNLGFGIDAKFTQDNKTWEVSNIYKS